MYDAIPIILTLTDPFTSRQALAAGLTHEVVARLVRNHEIERVQRGLFRVSSAPDRDGAHWLRVRRDHLARAREALMAHPSHALSHQTRAVATGWPVLLHANALVHLTAVTVEPRSRRVADRILHHSDSIINDVELVNGMPALTAPRTVADCLRVMPAPAGVAVADAALRSGSVSLADVEAVLESQHRWRGRPRALAALRLIDPRRETWLESYSFTVLHYLGVDVPVPQVEVYDDAFRFVARVDAMWVADATVGEADGIGKYLIADSKADGPTGRSAAERVVAERKRERGLLDLGLQVVRWDTEEILKRREEVARRVNAARAIGDIRRFRGHLRVNGEWIHPTRHRLSGESGSKSRRFAG